LGEDTVAASGWRGTAAPVDARGGAARVVVPPVVVPPVVVPPVVVAPVVVPPGPAAAVAGLTGGAISSLRPITAWVTRATGVGSRGGDVLAKALPPPGIR
jgi:hypothetical protein